MKSTCLAYATTGAQAPLQQTTIELGELRPEQIEIAVSHCGICHSDLSMLNNDWGMTAYPFVPGHEIVGRVVAMGDQVKKIKLGQTVGLGWFSESCMSCHQCMSGNHNLCGTSEQTIVQRHGGFAERVRCHWAWASVLPATGLDPAKAGPLFCGGITVFNPIIQCGVKPTDRVGVIGIGGLGHLAIKFLRAWGCEVTAFTSSESKREEAKQLGAHHVVNSRDSAQLGKITGSLDFILSTVNAAMDWPAFINVLAPKGRLHTVGAVEAPISLPVFPLLLGQKSLSGSPLGSPATVEKMLEFCARHAIEPTSEFFPMSRVNEAFELLKSGKARYRIILENDWAKVA